MRVFVDSCAVNRFALINVDPVKALAGSHFRLAVTPDLETEYRQATRHAYVEPYVKALIHALLVHCERSGRPEDWVSSPFGLDDDVQASERATRSSRQAPTRESKVPRHNRTDVHLIALARTEIVITDDAKLYRRWSDTVPGLVPWPRVEAHLKADGDLTDLLQRAMSSA